MDHKRTFYLLEQLILKYKAHQQCVSVKELPDGVDFYFLHRHHAMKFQEFVVGVVPCRKKVCFAARAHTHTSVHTHTHTHTDTHTHTHTYTHTYIHTHTYIYIHIYTYIHYIHSLRERGTAGGAIKGRTGGVPGRRRRCATPRHAPGPCPATPCAGKRDLLSGKRALL